jgi:tRNA A37 threonylcarbamoyladenosine synthetase subunit TsaC/SUA5/YrdC
MRRDFVYLVQTDTTVGFLSCDAGRLALLKERPLSKPFLRALPDLQSIDKVGRVPKTQRNFVRRSVRRSFILPNGLSFRVVAGEHYHVVKRFGWCFTTSANRHNEPFDEEYARKVSDVIIETCKGFQEKKASEIWMIGKEKKVRKR